MIKVFEIIVCMYLKTISPDVPDEFQSGRSLHFVYSIYNWSIAKNNIGQAMLFGKYCHCRIHFYIADVTQWSSKFGIRLSDLWCSVTMVWYQIASRGKKCELKILVIALLGLNVYMNITTEKKKQEYTRAENYIWK